MGKKRSVGGTQPSNRLSHGLSSRTRFTAWADVADMLLKAILEGVPQTPEIVEVVVDLVQTMLQLRAIDAEEAYLLTTLPPPRDFDIFLKISDFEEFRHEVIDSGFCEDPPLHPLAAKLLAVVKYPDQAAQYRPTLENTSRLIFQRKTELRRLDDYSRRALSRRNRLINRFDYLVTEELRRRNGEKGTQ